MNELTDDAIDTLLREQFDGPVPADGFSARVMAGLPARRRRHAWPLAAGIVAGAAVCGASLGSSPVAQIAWRDWMSGAPSAAAVTLLFAMTSLAVLALAWTMAEAGDR